MLPLYRNVGLKKWMGTDVVTLAPYFGARITWAFRNSVELIFIQPGKPRVRPLRE